MLHFSPLTRIPFTSFKLELTRILTEQQKKVAAVVLLALSTLALVYLLLRCCCFKAQKVEESDLDDPSSKREIPIDEAGDGALEMKLPNLRQRTAPQKELGTDILEARDKIKAGIPLYKRGEFKEAKGYFKKAMQLEPKNIEAVNHYARCLLRLGSKDKAEKYFEMALKIGPKNTFALIGHAEALLQQGKISEAKAEIEKNLTLTFSHAWGLFVYGEILHAAGDLNGANEAYLQGIIASKKVNIPGQLMRLNKLGNPQVAVWICQKLLQDKNASDYRTALNAFADELRKESFFDIAAQVFEKLVQHNPHDFFALSRYGDVLMHLNRAPEALTILTQAVGLVNTDIKDFVFVSALGKSLLAQNHLDLADGYFMAALLIAPNDVYARNQHAFILCEQGALDEAESNFQKVLELEPDNIFALNHSAEVLFKKDKFQEALDRFEQVLAIDPKDTFALSYLNQVEDALKTAKG